MSTITTVSSGIDSYNLQESASLDDSVSTTSQTDDSTSIAPSGTVNSGDSLVLSDKAVELYDKIERPKREEPVKKRMASAEIQTLVDRTSL